MNKSKLSPGSQVWLYARHSPGKGQSLHSQLEALKEYCETNGLIIAHTFSDAGKSGSDRNRAGFNGLVELALANKGRLVDGIVVYDSSRIARDMEETQLFRWLTRHRGYVLEQVIGERLDGIAGIFMDVVKDSQNQDYLNELLEKSKNGQRQMFKLKDDEGNYLRFWPGRRPWGFKQVRKTLPIIDTITKKNRVRQCIEPDYDLWPLGKELYQMRANGYSCRDIEAKTDFFGSRGSVDTDNSNRLAGAYSDFYRNEIYKGQLVYRELIINDYVPAMVSSELWQAANLYSVTYKRGNWPGYRHPRVGKGKGDFALQGLCECGLCNSLMYTVHPKAHLRYYLCRKKQRYGGDSCASRHVPAGPLEQAVIDHAHSHYLTGEFIQMVAEEISAILDNEDGVNDQIAIAEIEVTEASKGLYNLARLAERAITDEVWQRLRELEAQKKNAENKLKELRSIDLLKKFEVSGIDLEWALGNLTRRLSAIGEIKQALREIVSKIVVSPKEATIFYRLPLTISEALPKGIADFYQIGYVIQLPEKVKAEADSQT